MSSRVIKIEIEIPEVPVKSAQTRVVVSKKSTKKTKKKSTKKVTKKKPRK